MKLQQIILAFSLDEFAFESDNSSESDPKSLAASRNFWQLL